MIIITGWFLFCFRSQSGSDQSDGASAYETLGCVTYGSGERRHAPQKA